MINLQNLNNVIRSSLNLKPVKTPLLNQADKNKGASSTSFKGAGNLSGANLAPLKSDTISFTGHGLTIDTVTKSDVSDNHHITPLPSLAHSNIIDLPNRKPSKKEARRAGEEAKLSYYDNSAKNMDAAAYDLYREMKPIATDLHQQAQSLRNVFEIKMCIFDTLVSGKSSKKNKSGALADKYTRVKTVPSIQKKLANEVAKIKEGSPNSNGSAFVNADLAKTMIHDLFGARLILSNGSIHETNAVIKQIETAFEAGNGLKIKKIKNYGDHKYLTDSKLDQLSDMVIRAGYDEPEIVNKRKSSGYTATHIIFEVGKGLDAEIQILGRGVSRIKDVEDICYKGMQGKAIKGFGEISKELKKIGSDYDLRNKYNDYLSLAYELARKEWDKMPDDEIALQKFPSIDKNIFPACLDLNNIQAMMDEIAGK